MTDAGPTIKEALGLGITSLTEAIEELPWREVESSNLDRIAFCETEELPSRLPGGEGIRIGWLWVQFRGSGKVYAYKDVPASVFLHLEAAESPGRAHRKLIVGRYRYAGFDPKTEQTFIEGKR
jgi:hypothetical protein